MSSPFPFVDTLNRVFLLVLVYSNRPPQRDFQTVNAGVRVAWALESAVTELAAQLPLIS